MTSTRQQGALLIIVLWFIILVTILVGALSTEVRLSSKAVYHHKDNLYAWNDLLRAINLAQLEIVMSRMPPSPDDEVRQQFLKDSRNWFNRFDGRILDLAYPLPKNITVRIYDHSGRLNLRLLTVQNMRKLLISRIGDKDKARLDELIDVWQDWIDSDDMKRMSGAEKEFYEKLDPPYEPRNGRFETIEEFLLMKGFGEVFKDVPIESAFTIYGNYAAINPNVATREALSLIPGLSSDTIEKILVKRREKDFKSTADFNEFMQPEQLAEFLPWISFATSNFYTIAIQAKPPETSEEGSETPIPKEGKEKPTDAPAPPQTDPNAPPEEQRAYTLTVEFRGASQLPRVLSVNPYGILPDTRHELIPIEDKEKVATLQK